MMLMEFLYWSIHVGWLIAISRMSRLIKYFFIWMLPTTRFYIEIHNVFTARWPFHRHSQYIFNSKRTHRLTTLINKLTNEEKRKQEQHISRICSNIEIQLNNNFKKKEKRMENWVKNVQIKAKKHKKIIRKNENRKMEKQIQKKHYQKNLMIFTPNCVLRITKIH